MKMTPQRRALDKIYKRRDRYEIPEWQRREVWDTSKKQLLIDSILRDWRLPKFYFVKTSEDNYDVVDGQQRLAAVFDFFANELSLPDESVQQFGGPTYDKLKPKFSDAFDDFEIDFDEIEGASGAELKQFFQRLQGGLPLTSSEKLNSVDSKLRDFCRSLAKHAFLTNSIVVADTRYAHFDIVSKAAVLEIEGLEAGLRYDDIKPVFEAQSNFAATSAVARRLRRALDFLAAAFPAPNAALRNRTVVQSVITLACPLVRTGKSEGLQVAFAGFIEGFVKELGRQVELGQAATDIDFARFQKSVNANVKAGPRVRQEILLRNAFMYHPILAAGFDPSAVQESGLGGRVRELGDTIPAQLSRANAAFTADHGEDLFKPTNKAIMAMPRLGKPITDLASYTSFISDAYFVFHEGVGQRLGGANPTSFVDVNTLRTDLQHDLDHGDAGKAKAKKVKASATFKKYSGAVSPEVLDPRLFALVQANILAALIADLQKLAVPAS